MRVGLVFSILALFFSLTASATDLPVGKRIYTVQIGSFESKEKAFTLLQKAKTLPQARVSYRNGRYKVRVGFFKSYGEALRFVNNPSFRERFSNFYITLIRFSPKNVYFARSSGSQESKKPKAKETAGTVVKKEKKESENSEEVNKKVEAQNQTREVKIHYQDFLPSANKKEVKKSKMSGCVKSFENEDYESSYALGLAKWLALFFLFSLGVVYFSYAFLTSGDKETKDLEVLVGKFLEEENCEKLKEMLIPIVKTDKSNTFLRKVLIDCYLREKKFIEAAALCEEISEILKKEGLEVLASSFKAKAEEFLGKEFRGG